MHKHQQSESSNNIQHLAVSVPKVAYQCSEEYWGKHTTLSNTIRDANRVCSLRVIIITSARTLKIICEAGKMVERDAALYTISSCEKDILELCGDCVVLLDAFEDMDIITAAEKDDAYENEDFTCVIAKLKEKINADPGFFMKFCLHIKQIKGLSSIASTLLGEFFSNNHIKFIIHTTVTHADENAVWLGSSCVY